MNANEWSGVDSNPTFSYIFKFMGSISFGVIIIAVLVAFNRHTRRFLRFTWHITAAPMADLFLCGKHRKVEHEDLRLRPRDAEKGELATGDKKQ